jgi:hypothetical protein
MRNSSSCRRTTLYSVPLQKGLGPLEISLKIPHYGQQYNNIYNLRVEKHLCSTCYIKIDLVLYTKKPFSFHFFLQNCNAYVKSDASSRLAAGFTASWTVEEKLSFSK